MPDYYAVYISLSALVCGLQFTNMAFIVKKGSWPLIFEIELWTHWNDVGEYRNVGPKTLEGDTW